MRILHVIPSLSTNTGGPAFFTVQLSLGLKCRGHEVTIFATDAASPAKSSTRTARLKLSDVPNGAIDLQLNLFPLVHPYRLAYSPDLGQALRKHASQFDVIHAHMPNLYPQYAAWSAARASGVPFVFTPHGGLDPYIRSSGGVHKKVNDKIWQTNMLRRANALHASTVYEKRSLEEVSGNSNVIMIPLGVDGTTFGVADGELKSFDNFLTSDQHLIISHGRLDPIKGFDQLIRAVARLHERGINVKLRLIGSDYQNYGLYLRSLSRELQISERVEFLGDLRGTQLVEELRKASVWVSASNFESFGMAVVEALALGIPVVASDQVRIAEDAASHGALLLSRNTPEGLAYAIVRLISNPSLALSLASKGRDFARRLDWSNISIEFEQLYSSLLIRK